MKQNLFHELVLLQELLKHLGMPVLRATGEAEALCAQLNSEGLVDACITADSDAFLFGAKCVIKHVDPKSTVMVSHVLSFILFQLYPSDMKPSTISFYLLLLN